MNVLIFGIVFIFVVLFFPKGIIGIPKLLRRKKSSAVSVKET
jgi:ABC-type branched-subunit amino acid transport system permease subunit